MLLQSCPTLCDPIDGSTSGSPIPGILQARTLQWVAISFSSAWKWEVKVKSLSCVRLFATPWTAAYQAPPSMGFSRQEYWSGVPFVKICESWSISCPVSKCQAAILYGSAGCSLHKDAHPKLTGDWNPAWTLLNKLCALAWGLPHSVVRTHFSNPHKGFLPIIDILLERIKT